ncbi:MAG: hypothetical protein Q4G23_06160 [Clostridia bacterium]|nr:hypothetical protein [Clostridia bacterium]
MFCGNCGNQAGDGAKVCPHCGKILSVAQASPAPSPTKSKNKGTIITVIILLVAAIVSLCVIIFQNKKPKEVVYVYDETEESASETEAAEAPATEYYVNESDVTDSADTETAAPSEVFPRFVTYSPSYTYKSMPEIHYSTQADDDESFELKEFIELYNANWLNFVNYGDRSIYAYLRPNTQAYKYATNYGSKNITESFDLMKVDDVRKYGSNYYVWTHEIINEYSEGKTKSYEYHWVYKVGKDGSGIYVENYTKDPFYG